MACPDGDGPRPGLILIHEVWGLTDHIKDVADRLCAEGFETNAPDVFHGTEVEKVARPELAVALFDPDSHADKQVQLRALFTPISSPAFSDLTVAKLKAVFSYLKNHRPAAKIGVIGFCFGGTYAFKLATAEPELAAVAPFYGHAELTDEQVGRIKSPILAFYGDQDTALVEKLPALKQQMQNAGVDFDSRIYAGAKHAFFNDTNPLTYNKQAASDAWGLALKFLHEKLG